MAEKQFLVRVIDHYHDQRFWDIDLEPTEETIDDFPHEEFLETPENIIALIQDCTQHEPPTQEELDALEPGHVLKKVTHKDHSECDWGAIDEGYVVKRLF